MLGNSKSVLGGGMVMMLLCHHLNAMRMCRHRVDIPLVEPSLADERASQNFHNRTGCVKEEMMQTFPAAAVSILS